MEDSLDRGDAREDRDEEEGRGKRCSAVAAGQLVDPAADVDEGEPCGEDDDADLARRDTDCRHAAARREAEALGSGPRVADEEGCGHRGGSQESTDGKRGRAAGVDDAEVDDGLAGAVEGRIHERAEARCLARRAGERPVEQVEDATADDEERAGQPRTQPAGDGGQHRDPETDDRERVRCESEPPEATRDRVGEEPNARSELGADETPTRHEATPSADGRASSPRTSRSRRTNVSHASGTSVWTVSRPARRARTRPAARRRPRCHDTSGCDRPTWSMSWETVAGATARRRTIRRRLTSASALWTSRSSRRSSG